MRKKPAKAAAAALTTLALTMAIPTTASAAPAPVPDGTLFDAEYYAEQNPDVVAVYGINMYKHWLEYGKAEGRLPNATNAKFDPVYYAEQNPDVVAVYGTKPEELFRHYLEFGYNEGRLPYAPETQSEQPAAPAAPETQSEQPAAPETSAATDEAAEETALVNALRSENGLPALVCDAGLTEYANLRAKELAQSFSHTRPDGSNPLDGVSQVTGYHGWRGENIAMNFRSIPDVVNGWANSPGHRANMLHANFTKIGIGHYQQDGNDYWVQVFSS